MTESSESPSIDISEVPESQTMSFGEALQMGIGLHRQDAFDRAEQVYLRLLELQPRNPDVLHFLGVLRNDQGRFAESIQLIESALGLAPFYVDAWANLGNVYRLVDRREEAEAAYRKAVDLNPAHIGAINNLATLFRQDRKFREALELHHRAIELWPEESGVYFSFANTVRECGDPDIAIAAYRKAIELNPAHSEANHRFGYLLWRVGRREEAIAIFRDWVATDPTNPIATHLLAACTGEGVPERASDDFVRDVFDGFADSFDENLVDKLEYRAPEFVARAVGKLHREDRALDVLDAGCGTGLCAPQLRPFARVLTGIDLSRRMLHKAHARGGYDRLLQTEITEFLGQTPASYDLIASADTLVYFGALESVAANARTALRDGGHLVFTVERLDGEDAEGYDIGPHGRYTHSARYLREVLTGAGFEILAMENEVLRKEGGWDVDGFVVTAKASGPFVQS